MIKKHSRTIVVIVVAVSCTLLALIISSARNYVSKKSTKLVQHVKLFSKWQSLPFVAIDDTLKFNEFMSSIPIDERASLSDDQRNKLRASIIKLLLAYSQGSYEAYMAFRAPPGSYPQLDPNTIDFIHRAWLHDTNVAHKHFPQGTDELYDWYLRRYSGGNYYKGFWMGVCLHGDLLTARLDNPGVPLNFGICTRSVTNYISFFPELRRSQQTNQVLWDVAFPQVDFTFRESPRKVLENETLMLITDIYCFVKRREPYAPCPIFARFYWELQSKQWLPMDLAEGYILKQKPYQRRDIVMLF